MNLIPRRQHIQAFTLIELMVVLGIIVVILVTAVPVFNTLTGNHSLATAQNQVAALLGTARSDAVYYRQITGIMFFVDPATGQVALAEVQVDPQPAGAMTYNPATNAASPKIVSPGIAAPNNGEVYPLELANTWDSTQTKFTYFRDITLLPSGVGVAMNNNYYGYTYASASTVQPFDHYVRLGAIMFDANGMVTSVPFAIQQIRLTPYGATFVNQLGRRLGLTTTSGDWGSIITPPTGTAIPPNRPANAVYPLTSQVGLLFYDHDAFLNQRAKSGTSFSDQDLEYTLPSQASAPSVAPADKFDEETWLDQNGVAVLVSPFSGELINAK